MTAGKCFGVDYGNLRGDTLGDKILGGVIYGIIFLFLAVWVYSMTLW